MTQPWWDIVSLTAIGLICLVLMAHRLWRTFHAAPGAGCSCCSKGCGAGDGAKMDKPCSP